MYIQENISFQFPAILPLLQRNMADQISLKNPIIIGHCEVFERELLTVQVSKILVSDVKNKQAGHHNFLFVSIFYFCAKKYGRSS